VSVARRLAAPIILLLLAASPAKAASFADVARLSLAAPVVVRATIYKAERLKPRNAPDVALGSARMLVSAATTAAIAAPREVPPRITYLIDVPLDARGKPPPLLHSDVLLFLRGDPAVPGQYALVDGRGQIDWSVDVDAAIRAVLTNARSGTVPVVTGVTSAFRVPGAVPGEAESQFFLSTADAKPVSLVVLTRPGQARRLSIALGDVIDDAATGVRPGTLLWYRLACFLPETLPTTIDAGAGVADDYRFVLKSLGACGRTF
jgi:hypothetical protein